MAEININEIHNHGYTRYGGNPQNAISSAPGVMCNQPHLRCIYPTYASCLQAVSVPDNSGSLLKRTGEIKANPSHRHSYKRVTGSSGTRYDLAWIACALGHPNCAADSWNAISVAVTGSDVSYDSSYTQGLGEINLNLSHKHSFFQNQMQGNIDKPWWGGPHNHGVPCVASGYFTALKLTYSTINFSNGRLQ